MPVTRSQVKKNKIIIDLTQEVEVFEIMEDQSNDNQISFHDDGIKLNIQPFQDINSTSIPDKQYVFTRTPEWVDAPTSLLAAFARHAPGFRQSVNSQSSIESMNNVEYELPSFMYEMDFEQNSMDCSTNSQDIYHSTRMEELNRSPAYDRTSYPESRDEEYYEIPSVEENGWSEEEWNVLDDITNLQH